MSNITVQDNFLPIDFFRNLQSKMVSPDFPWYLSGTVRDDDTEHSPLWYNDTNTFGENNYQLVHVAYHSYGFSSDLLSDEVTVLAEKINAAAFLKIKCNLVQRRSDIQEWGLHNDMRHAPENSLTSILYMNTNNGYTRFETGEKVESVENRFVTFPSRIQHTGTTNNCNAPFRCVMNINWIKKLNNGETI